MAQIVKLRRSSVTGRKPTNAQLQLGELSINTTDGKVFLAKSGSGGPSIEEIVTTNSTITGSLNISNSITAGFFIGDGSGLTNVDADTAISSSYATTASFASLAYTIQSVPGASVRHTELSPSTTWNFNHNLGEEYPDIIIYDIGGRVVIPTSIESVDSNNTRITFSTATAGYATATVGGGIPAISPSNNGYVFATDGISGYWANPTTIDLAVTSANNTFTGNQTISGLLTVSEVTETLTMKPGLTSGTNTFDFSGGSVFYMTGMTANSTFNITNVPTTTSRATTVTFVIQQGSTPYSGSAYQINGSTQTIKWVDGTVPTGSANKTDIIGLTIFRVGTTWNVVGSLSTFG